MPQKSVILILASRKRIKRQHTTVFNGRHFHLMFPSWNRIKKKKNVLSSPFKYRYVLTIFFNFFTNRIVRYWHRSLLCKNAFFFLSTLNTSIDLNIFSRHCYGRPPCLHRLGFVRWILIVFPETIEKKQKLSRTLTERLALSLEFISEQRIQHELSARRQFLLKF